MDANLGLTTLLKVMMDGIDDWQRVAGRRRMQTRNLGGPESVTVRFDVELGQWAKPQT